jgi:hypothetical protein
MIDYLRFNISLIIRRRHHCRWRAAKFRPMLGAQGLWAGRDLYRATPAVTRDLGFSGLIRRTAPFSRLLRHTRGCGGSILTRILTGTEMNISVRRDLIGACKTQGTTIWSLRKCGNSTKGEIRVSGNRTLVLRRCSCTYLIIITSEIIFIVFSAIFFSSHFWEIR